MTKNVTGILVCLQIAHKYLVEKHLSPADETQFKEQLYRIWFELYARKGSSRWVESATVTKCNLKSGTMMVTVLLRENGSL